MFTSMSALWRMTVYAFFLGIAFGALYDAFRITRVFLGAEYKGAARKSADFLYSKKYPLIGYPKRRSSRLHKGLLNIAVGIGDIIFCLIVGSSLCIFFYYTNDGILRFQAIMAVFLGFLLYYKTVGALVICFAEIICIFLKIISKIFLFAIAIPFRIMYNIFIRVCRSVFGFTVAPLILSVQRFRTERLKKELLLRADSGLLLDFMKRKAFDDAIGR